MVGDARGFGVTALELGRVAMSASSDYWAMRLKGTDSSDKSNWPTTDEILAAVGEAIRKVQMNSDIKCTAYMCGTDMRFEMQAPDMLGDCKITPNQRYAEEDWSCTAECGVAEVEVRFVRWVKEPTI